MKIIIAVNCFTLCYFGLVKVYESKSDVWSHACFNRELNLKSNLESQSEKQIYCAGKRFQFLSLKEY